MDQKETVDEVAEEAVLAAKSFVEQLSDAGKFSYLALCSTALSLLFGKPEDKDYRHKTIYSLVKYVGLENNCYPTMVAISDGMSLADSNVFVKTLKEEDVVKETPLAIAADLVAWALLGGDGDGSECNLRGRYDSRTRILLRHITWQLRIVLEDLEKTEHEMVKMLEARTERESAEQDEQRNKNRRNQKIKRYTLIGLAAIGGGAIIGLTGGLAAPLVATGAGAIFGASSAAALGSVAGLAVITSLFGAAGAGLTGYKMKRRVGGIDQFVFKPLTPGKELTVTIAVSGWLSSSQGQGDFVTPWLTMRQSQEQYYLAWESDHLKRLGGALEYILDSLVSVAASEALKYTVLSGLVAAVAWPASLLSASSIIDNPWSVCLQRATQVGKELAEVLLSRQHGHRPVTLVGFSLGARVIFHCLEEMSKRKNHAGIVEDVFLLGAPVTGEAEKWSQFSKVVSGHITNGYCRSDWLLKFLYRTSSRQSEVAGLHPVEWKDRRMINIDLSSLVNGHMDYRTNMGAILPAVGVRTNEESPHITPSTSNGTKKSKSLQQIAKDTVDTELKRSSTVPHDMKVSVLSDKEKFDSKNGDTAAVNPSVKQDDAKNNSKLNDELVDLKVSDCSPSTSTEITMSNGCEDKQVSEKATAQYHEQTSNHVDDDVSTHIDDASSINDCAAATDSPHLQAAEKELSNTDDYSSSLLKYDLAQN